MKKIIVHQQYNAAANDESSEFTVHADHVVKDGDEPDRNYDEGWKLCQLIKTDNNLF